MSIESPRDVEGLRHIGHIVAACMRHMQRALAPGITTRELDAIGADFLRREGARSAPQITYGFPGATCISVNHEAAHGVPSGRVVRPGDVVNIDVSAEKDGYFGDTGGSFPVPPVPPRAQAVCDAAQRALASAMARTRAGQPLRVIGAAIEAEARRSKLKVIRNLCSHGIGRRLHDAPEMILPYADPRDRRMLTEGLVITIEPFLSTGATWVKEAPDGWTLESQPGDWHAQYEHTLIVTRGEPIVLTA